MMPFFADAFVGLGIVALALKLIEMSFHISALARLPHEYAAKATRALASWRRHEISDSALRALVDERLRVWEPPSLWPVTRVLFQLRLRLAAKYLFRWPILMAFNALLLLLASQPRHLWPLLLAVLFGLWLELTHRFLSRLQWGHLDTMFRRVDRYRLGGTSDFLQLATPPTRLELVRDFVLTFVKLAGAVLLCHWALFVAATRLESSTAFSGLTAGHVHLRLFYFSAVTLATVGYGDVAPTTPLAIVLVSSEILMGLSLLVLLVTAFSLTSDGGPEDAPFEPQTQATSPQPPASSV